MRALFGVAAAAVVLALGACDAGSKATAQAPALPVTKASVTREQAPLIGGKPGWAGNKKHTAMENAVYQFEKNGADFSAGSVEDYMAEAHAFAAKPPKGTQMTTRGNGDVLLYDAKSNVFAVVAKDGAPRTLFKPRDGAKYWAEQKERAGKDAERDEG